MHRIEDLKELNRAINKNFGYSFELTKYGDDIALRYNGEKEMYIVYFNDYTQPRIVKKYIFKWVGGMNSGIMAFSDSDGLIEILENVRLPVIRPLR